MLETKEIMKTLNKLGVPTHLKGYTYLVEGIKLCAENPAIQITKELYIEIAKKYEDTPGKVERAIRHAIEVTSNNCDVEAFNKIFGNTIRPNKRKPTNAQFCKTVANYLKYNL